MSPVKAFLILAVTVAAVSAQSNYGGYQGAQPQAYNSYAAQAQPNYAAQPQGSYVQQQAPQPYAQQQPGYAAYQSPSPQSSYQDDGSYFAGKYGPEYQ